MIYEIRKLISKEIADCEDIHLLDLIYKILIAERGGIENGD